MDYYSSFNIKIILFLINKLMIQQFQYGHSKLSILIQTLPNKILSQLANIK